LTRFAEEFGFHFLVYSRVTIWPNKPIKWKSTGWNLFFQPPEEGQHNHHVITRLFDRIAIVIGWKT
jgi:hypothetical protein